MSDRWKPGGISRDEAEAIARQFATGNWITERERVERFKNWIQEQFEKIEKSDTYYTLNEIKGYMKEKGLKEYTGDIDKNILQQTVCEEICARELSGKNLTGPDLDSAYWECVHECSPIRDPMTMDMDDPLYPHSDVDPDVFTTSLSLPGSPAKKATDS
jgi:hypothetical protein